MPLIDAMKLADEEDYIAKHGGAYPRHRADAAVALRLLHEFWAASRAWADTTDRPAREKFARLVEAEQALDAALVPPEK